VIGFVALPVFCFANNYPSDANTIYVRLGGIFNTQILPAGERTILGVSLTQDTGIPITAVLCGSNVISETSTIYPIFIPISYVCDQAIYLKKDSGGSTNYVRATITYVDYHISTGGTGSEISAVSDGTNNFYIDKKVNYGELVIIFFIILFLMLKIFELVFDFFLPKVFKVFSKNL